MSLTSSRIINVICIIIRSIWAVHDADLMSLNNFREKLNDKKVKKYVLPYLYWLLLASLIEVYYGIQVRFSCNSPLLSFGGFYTAAAYYLFFTALSTATVAAFNFFQDVRIFGKQENGSVSLLHLIYIHPYYYVYRAIVHAHRLVIHKEPVVSHIHSKYYLAGWMDDTKHYVRAVLHAKVAQTSSASTAASVPSEFAILDLTCELPRRLYAPACPDSIGDPSTRSPGFPQSRYLCVPTFDRSAPVPSEIDRCVIFVLSQVHGRDVRSSSPPVTKGVDVIIHCAFGHGRSATVLLACLLADGIVPSIEAGIALLKRHRPLVSISGDQLDRLTTWKNTYLDAWVSRRRTQASPTTAT